MDFPSVTPIISVVENVSISHTVSPNLQKHRRAGPRWNIFFDSKSVISLGGREKVGCSKSFYTTWISWRALCELGIVSLCEPSDPAPQSTPDSAVTWASGLRTCGFRLPIRLIRRRHHDSFHLNVRCQVPLYSGRLEGRLCAADIFGCRFHDMEHDPCRHDAVNDGLQPTNVFSLVGNLVLAQATDCVPPCRS